MTDIAKAAGITREALYKALRPGSAPRFDTVNRVCTALGVLREMSTQTSS
jgi:probable addiction module antidote protein